MADNGASETSTWRESAAAPLAGFSAATFAALSALRRNRVFHPVGEAYLGTLDLWAPAEHGLFNGTHSAVVRFSRGMGLPEPLPDVLGLAIKIPQGRHNPEQDFLLASSGRAPVGRNLLVPSKNFFRCIYSSVLPYRRNGTSLLFGGRADDALKDRKGDFGDVDRAALDGDLRFELLAARPTGPWEQIGALHVTEHCAQHVSRELQFNPWNTDSELQPSGALNRLRRSAYPASQAARPDSE